MSPDQADGVSIVALSIEAKPRQLVVFDAHRRTYLGLSRDGSYFHVIRPARLDDPPVGDGKVAAGELTCNCAAGAYGRTCYWVELAAAFETGDRGFVVGTPDPDDAGIPWMRGPVAAGAPVEARGK